jgi:hypothetical protein
LEMASDVRIGGTVRSGEVKPSLNRAVMKTDARALTQGARGKPQLLEPPDADPHVRWCGRGEQATAPPIPIALLCLETGRMRRPYGTPFELLVSLPHAEARG